MENNKVRQALMAKMNKINTAPKPEYQMQMQAPQQHVPVMKIDTQEDFRRMPYEGKAKYDNQLKAMNATKDQMPQRNPRPKKMFFQHYDTQQPYCPIIQNNSNPSGRPPNIPPEMYQGITVKPKRPWVYLGTQNLPPVQYQQINESSFRNIAKKNMEAKQQNKNRRLAQAQNAAQNVPPKPRKKLEKQQSINEQNSQLDISDEIVDEGQSIFASQYNTETINKQSDNKKSRMSSIRNSQRSYLGDEYSMSQGTETRNKGVQVFGSDDDQESDMYSKSKSRNMQGKSKKDQKGRKKQEFSDDDE